MAPLHCLSLLYSGSAVGDRKALGPPRLPLGSARFPDHSAGPQTGQFGRSEAEAKLHRLGLVPVPTTTVASCEAIRGPDHGSLGLALPARPRSPSKSHHGYNSVFVGLKAKRLNTLSGKVLLLKMRNASLKRHNLAAQMVNYGNGQESKWNPEHTQTFRQAIWGVTQEQLPDDRRQGEYNRNKEDGSVRSLRKVFDRTRGINRSVHLDHSLWKGKIFSRGRASFCTQPTRERLTANALEAHRAASAVRCSAGLCGRALAALFRTPAPAALSRHLSPKRSITKRGMLVFQVV